MKKNKFVIGLLIFLGASCLFAQEKKIAVFNPETHGLSDDEKNWLPASVRRKLESNINAYTDCIIIDVQNESLIKELQKKSEGIRYTKESSIELGKMVSAEYAVISSITKSGGKYILSSQITNLSTGVTISSVTTDSVQDCSMLFDGPSSSVNIVTVKFCRDLGIPLSSVDEYSLLEGKNLSEEEQIKMAKKEIDSYNQKKQELENQLKEIAVSQELDKEARRARLDAKKQLLEQQQEITRERYERLKKNQEKLQQDKLEQLQRSNEQKKKIDAAVSEIDKKAALLRAKKMEGLSLDSQITIIEAKKQVLVELRDNLKAQEAMIIDLAKKEYKERAAEIDQIPLRNAEKDAYGNMLPEVKKTRQAQKKKIKTEIEDRATSEVELLYSRINEQEKALLKTINEDLATLKTVRTISSLDDNRILSVDNYAGDLYSWFADAKLYILDYCIFTQSVNISYEKLAGKKPVHYSAKNEEAYNDYLDTVDMYDYMFRRQIPAVALEIDYKVEALEDDRPSCYRVTVLEFRYVDIKTNAVIQKIIPSSSSYVFKLKPSLDIRENENAVNKYSNSKDIPSYSRDASRAESATNTRIISPNKSEPKTASENKSSKSNNVSEGRFNIGAMIGYIDSFHDYEELLSNFTGYIYATTPFSDNVFLQLDFGIYYLPEQFYSGISSDSILPFTMYASIGTNRLFFNRFNVYGTFGVGVVFCDYKKPSYDFYGIDWYDYTFCLFSTRLTCGVDYKITDLTAITSECGLVWASDYDKWNGIMNFGIALSF